MSNTSPSTGAPKMVDIDVIVRECLHKIAQIVLRARIPNAYITKNALRDDKSSISLKSVAAPKSTSLLQQQLAQQQAIKAAAAAAAAAQAAAASEQSQPQSHLVPSSDSMYSIDGTTGGGSSSSSSAKPKGPIAIGKRPSVSAPDSAAAAAAEQSAAAAAAAASASKKENKWFNLILEEMPSVRELLELEIKRSDQGLHSTLQIEVLIAAPALQQKMILLERWNMHYEPNEMNIPAATKKADPSNMYKRMIIFIRSLFSYVRLLPSYHLYKLAAGSASAAAYEQKADESPFQLLYGIGIGATTSARPASVFDSTPANFVFSSINTEYGKLHLNVFYRRDANFEFATRKAVSLDHHFIKEYIPSDSSNRGGAGGITGQLSHTGTRPNRSSTATNPLNIRPTNDRRNSIDSPNGGTVIVGRHTRGPSGTGTGSPGTGGGATGGAHSLPNTISPITNLTSGQPIVTRPAGTGAGIPIAMPLDRQRSSSTEQRRRAAAAAGIVLVPAGTSAQSIGSASPGTSPQSDGSPEPLRVAALTNHQYNANAVPIAVGGAGGSRRASQTLIGADIRAFSVPDPHHQSNPLYNPHAYARDNTSTMIAAAAGAVIVPPAPSLLRPSTSVGRGLTKPGTTPPTHPLTASYTRYPSPGTSLANPTTNTRYNNSGAELTFDPHTRRYSLPSSPQPFFFDPNAAMAAQAAAAQAAGGANTVPAPIVATGMATIVQTGFTPNPHATTAAPPINIPITTNFLITTPEEEPIGAAPATRGGAPVSGTQPISIVARSPSVASPAPDLNRPHSYSGVFSTTPPLASHVTTAAHGLPLATAPNSSPPNPYPQLQGGEIDFSAPTPTSTTAGGGGAGFVYNTAAPTATAVPATGQQMSASRFSLTGADADDNPIVLTVNPFKSAGGATGGPTPLLVTSAGTRQPFTAFPPPVLSRPAPAVAAATATAPAPPAAADSPPPAVERTASDDSTAAAAAAAGVAPTTVAGGDDFAGDEAEGAFVADNGFAFDDDSDFGRSKVSGDSEAALGFYIRHFQKRQPLHLFLDSNGKPKRIPLSSALSKVAQLKGQFAAMSGRSSVSAAATATSNQ